jgi:SAM-dependent methyltransferase
VLSKGIGYTEEEVRSAPEGADMGLGCGNPTALASLAEGETVLDLGSGAGFDCFLAARKVGEKGRVIGVDMTPEMIEKARGNAKKGGFGNVEFRLGEIENLPAADASVDVILSNCVINLSTEKERVFTEAYRVLRPGGRVMISDLVLTRDLPEPVRSSLEAYAGCIGGAVPLPEYFRIMESAGFRDLRVVEEKAFDIASEDRESFGKWFADAFRIPLDVVRDAAGSIASVSLYGRKPE